MRHPRTSKPVSFVRGILPTVYLYNNDLLAESTLAVECGYELRNNGQLWVTDGSGAYYRPGAVQDWMQAGSPAQFEVFATFLSGDTANGTFGSWLSLSTTRNWNLQSPDTVLKQCAFDVMIRIAGEQTPRWQCLMSLTADATL